jgi:DNA-binding PadR family transcriptional regulator
MFNHDPRHRPHFGFFGPHRRWADDDPRADWFFGRGGRRWGGFGGFEGRGERFFGRGDLKYVILDLLKEQPRHGYDIIRALEDRMRGRYRPSPGSVYPTLQMLEDLGYVTSTQQDGKRVYAITDAGRQYLHDESSAVDDVRSRIASGWEAASRPEVADIMHELQMLGRALFRQGTRGALQDPARLARLREIVASARHQVEELGDVRPTPATPNDEPPTGAPPAEPRMV